MRRTWWPIIMLAGLLLILFVTAGPMPDVHGSVWYVGEMWIAHTLRIAVGYPDGAFRPAAAATRAEMFLVSLRVILWAAIFAALTGWFVWESALRDEPTDRSNPADNSGADTPVCHHVVHCHPCHNTCCACNDRYIPPVLIVPAGVEADRALAARRRALKKEEYPPRQFR